METIAFIIESAKKCNLRCTMCPLYSCTGPSGHMSLDTYRSIANYLDHASRVNLTGWGEPLLNPDIYKMIRIAKASGRRVGFETNGVLLDEETCRNLVHEKLDQLAISMDGSTAKTYEKIRKGASFEKVIGNIELLNRVKRRCNSTYPSLSAIFVVMKSNIEELSGFVALASQLGIEQVTFKNLDVLSKPYDLEETLICFEKDDRSESLRILEKVLAAEKEGERLDITISHWGPIPPGMLSSRRPMCLADPLHTIFISWDGFVSPCCNLGHALPRLSGGKQMWQPHMRFGNVLEEPITHIWEGPEFSNFRKRFEEKGHPEACLSCPLLFYDRDMERLIAAVRERRRVKEVITHSGVRALFSTNNLEKSFRRPRKAVTLLSELASQLLFGRGK